MMNIAIIVMLVLHVIIRALVAKGQFREWQQVVV